MKHFALAGSLLAGLFLAPSLWSAPVPTPSPAPIKESFSSLIVDLKGIEAEMVENQNRLEVLQAEILRLQSLGKGAEAQIQELQSLVEAHAARVQQLGERYGKVLVMAQKLKKDLEWSATLNYVLGGTAAVAVVVAVVEGLALAFR